MPTHPHDRTIQLANTHLHSNTRRSHDRMLCRSLHVQATRIIFHVSRAFLYFACGAGNAAEFSRFFSTAKRRARNPSKTKLRRQSNRTNRIVQEEAKTHFQCFFFLSRKQVLTAAGKKEDFGSSPLRRTTTEERSAGGVLVSFVSR